MPMVGYVPGLVQARPSLDPPCGSHQLPVILKYSERIFGTQLSQILLVGTLPAGITSCWRAVARQPTILYNSEIWPKSVGCKIVDLRSRMRSLYPGACGFADMRSPFFYIRDMLVNARGNIDRFHKDVCCL